MQPYNYKYLHCKMEAGFSTVGEDYVEVLAKYVMAIVTGGNVMEEEPEPGWVGYTRDVRTVLFWVILVKDQTELVRNPYSR